MIYKAQQDSKKGLADSQQSWFATLIPSLFRPFSWRRNNDVREDDEELLKERPHHEKIPLWIQDIANAQKTTDNSDEFVDGLKEDFFSYRIFVFTPEGDVVDLPVGASPIDFAYAIHSEIGDHIQGALVNKKLVGLNTELRNGDIVEIVKKETSHPTAKWLDFTKTSLAKRRIRAYLNAQNEGATAKSS